jgi:hypothetical protein
MIGIKLVLAFLPAKLYLQQNLIGLRLISLNTFEEWLFAKNLTRLLLSSIR